MCIGLNIVFSINACMSYFSPILKFSFVVSEPVKKIVIVFRDVVIYFHFSLSTRTFKVTISAFKFLITCLVSEILKEKLRH